jgi:hypothetical protein
MAENLNVSELDFHDIKNNLKDFLKSQDEFVDYNFEGSAINALLDVMAYTTHYNAFNANMAIKETFLDTAQLRASVVSHAKLLGYTPRSAYAPRANIKVTINNPSNVQNSDGSYKSITMNRGTIFDSIIEGVTYTFVNTKTISIPRENSAYIFEDVEIIQGNYNTTTYTFDVNTSEKFIIPWENSVTSSLIVTVSESINSSESESYTLSTNLVDILGDTKAYWLQEGKDGFYEVYFGDGIIGKKLGNGNIITLEYVVTKGALSNGASTFTLLDNIDGQSDVTIETLDIASGGSLREDKESIKFNAPLGFVAQNRAVTPDDYKTIIQSNFANIRAITVWGGEDNDPPDYGKVYVTIAPKDSEALTFSDKEFIKATYLKPKNVVSITPEILDPTYTYIHLEVFFKYNPNTTNDNVDSLEEKVRGTLRLYQENELKRFDGVFRYSVVLHAIDATDFSIINSMVRVYMKKRFVPTLGAETKYELKFSSPIIKTSIPSSIISSTEFIYLTKTCTLQDTLNTLDGRRTIQIIDTNNIVLHNNIGYIEESEGKVILDGFNPASIVDSGVDYLEVTVQPNSNDMAPNRNELLTIMVDDAVIKGEIDTMITGGTSAGINYTTTSVTK